jgi:hypothetical protein
MNIHELNALHLIHVAAVLVLVAYTFFAFAGPVETKKRVMMITGIATTVVLLTGIRMWQALFGFAPLGWIVVKLVCWLGLSALTGLTYRLRDKSNLLMIVALVLAITALAMVYVKPF